MRHKFLILRLSFLQKSNQQKVAVEVEQVSESESADSYKSNESLVSAQSTAVKGKHLAIISNTFLLLSLYKYV